MNDPHDGEDIILSELPDDELVEQMHDDLYDGLADEIVDREADDVLLEAQHDDGAPTLLLRSRRPLEAAQSAQALSPCARNRYGYHRTAPPYMNTMLWKAASSRSSRP